MEVVVQKWGNSHAIRIPKLVLKTAHIEENDRVSITMIDNGFSVEKVEGHVKLSDRLERFYNKPVEEIEKINNEEYNWGEPEGREVW